MNRIRYFSNKTNGKSFTLIELLVVIAIIGILAALITPNLRDVRAKARDAKRVEDLRQLQTALEMYYSDHQSYPSGNIGSNSQNGFCLERSLNEDGSCPSDKFCDLIKPHLARLPRDPLFKWSDTSSPCYFYITDTNTTSTAQAYKAAAKMEKDLEKAENDGGTDNSRYEISDTRFKGLSLSFLPQKSHIVGFWQFEETSNPIVDQTGNNNGTYYGTLWQQTGIIDYCLGFDGTDDWILTTLNEFPAVMTDVTISFWAKPPTSNKMNALFSAQPDDGTNRFSLHFPWYGITMGKIYLDFGNISAGGRLDVTFDQSWFNVMAHWVFIVKSGVGMKAYRNNVLIASNTTTSTFTKGSKTLWIAKYSYMGYHFWPGDLDEVIIWDKALTADEITTLYANGAPTRSLYSY